MIRFCPNCETERSPAEMFCEGQIGGNPCDFPLSDQPLRPSGWRPAPPAASAPAPLQHLCENGHPMDAGDLICSECGADAQELDVCEASPSMFDEVSEDGNPAEQAENSHPTSIGDWTLVRRLDGGNAVYEQFEAERASDGLRAIVTLYSEGCEPDPEVYNVLRRIDRDHVPEIFEIGRLQDRVYEISEEMREGSLSSLGLLNPDLPALSRIVQEIGGALAALSESGLRHRDLHPACIMVRSREPLDLTITGFGSARLSDYDLEVVSPLEITRYTAPEAVAGGVAASSDWWSLGMILLEQVTQGACFAGAEDQAFLISVLTNGPPIPHDLAPEVDTLLRGLLAPDRRQRWGWNEVRSWLAGEQVSAPSRRNPYEDDHAGRTIALGGKRYASPGQYALAAAEAANWEEAKALLLRGELATWMEEAGLHPDLLLEIRRILALEEVADDFRHALVLKTLNPLMPLVVRGEIVTPGWLLDHPEEGYALISGPVPDRLESEEDELWLARLKRREQRIRERARRLEVELDEASLRPCLLSTSKARLASRWEARRAILPDTDHPGLLGLVERKVTEEEDLILLLGSAASQFRSADAILAEAQEIAQRLGIGIDPIVARSQLLGSSGWIVMAIDSRIENFARCGIDQIDDWADKFRLERRLPVARCLVLLSLPPERWQQPPRQKYIALLLDFFSRRITGAVMRGPLTRMLVGKTTARIDLAELDSERRTARELLDHILLRNDQTISVDPGPLADDPRLERRLRTLNTHASLYRRDTGINGLYLGFPFLLMQPTKASLRPRIAPVLLWPVRVTPEVGGRGRITLAFDRDREEVRLNPAFETMLGVDEAERWKKQAEQLLGRASITAAEVVEAFSEFAELQSRQLSPLPAKDLKMKAGEDRIACSAVLFHLGFLGQAVMEDMRKLRGMSPLGSSLDTAFRVRDEIEPPTVEQVPERDRYFTSDSDPSQEAAVLEARTGPGLVVEGPPGTGKSQTIVNMVADAIGTGRSLLVVCQKQAALEVVHKRLEAAGLGSRILMVTDVNRDREPIIRAIREQLDEVFRRHSGASLLRQQREQMAARIEVLERELDAHHDALHAEDPATGSSYRLILGELVQLARAGETPSVPSLRQILCGHNPASLTLLQEVCAPLAKLWLPAHYEGSALAETKPCGIDQGTLETFRQDFEAFVSIERERRGVIERTPDALAIDDPEPYRRWADDHSTSFIALDDATRDRLARWLELLSGTATRPHGTTAVQIALREVEQAFLSMSCEPATRQAADVVRALSQEELDNWSSVSAELLTRPNFFARLSPSRWMASRRLKRFLQDSGLSASPEFNAALCAEQEMRPARERLCSLLVELGEPTRSVKGQTVEQLLQTARDTAQSLNSVETLVARLEAYPQPEIAFAMARVRTRSAVEDLVEGIEQGLARHAARSASAQVLKRLELWMSEGWIERATTAIGADGTDTGMIEAVERDLPHLAAYQRFRPRVSHLDATALAVFAELARVRMLLESFPSDELDPVVRRIIATEARLAWKHRLESERPALLAEADELDSRAKSLADADIKMRELNKRHLVEGLDASKLRPQREWDDVTRLRGVRAKRLREFVERGADLGLMHLRPVWLVNPDVASRLLPLEKSLFDTVIFDEASQMPIEYALPTLYRSRRMIVSGDEKQMPPTSFFTSRIELEEAEAYEGQDESADLADDEREAVVEEWNRREIKDCPDLLQLAKTVLPSTTLKIHYRSVYRELIQFSNASFYANRLSVPARHPADEIRRVKPIEVIRAEGVYEDQTNRIEAERVVEQLQQIWLHSHEIPTVGVVTFNRKQADLIEEVLEEAAERDEQFRWALSRERDRFEDGEDMGFFVKNVENVQGDERDVIIFSSTFGRNSQGSFRRSFGVLGQAGGERRLNVAVTRARQKVVLVTSMPIALISDLLETRRQAVSPRDFLQAYFEYARCVSSGDLDSAGRLLSRLTNERPDHVRAASELRDGLEDAVAEEIRALGWTPSPVSEDGAFGLDFAIEDPRTGLYGIGIECDAPRDPLLAKARAREIWRRSVLGRSIPVIHRVSSHRWYNEPEVERARLKEAVRGAMGAGS